MSSTDLLATVMATHETGGARAASHDALPHRIGRYVVLSRLGAGAMGVVLAAYDEKLDRKVALKLLPPSAAGDPELVARMRREGQALAQVSHPNIVNVYEVGLDAGVLFLAMEFVPGQTLERWAGPDRTWREVLDVHLQAARGLVAAHRCRLVHRDYKPANVMIGDDGRVRVLDFGLARREVAAEADEAEPLEVSAEDTSARERRLSHSARSRVSGAATQVHAVMGTPRYMSAEQFLGLPATERSDQFSFCVALYEALVGQPPFGGDSMAELSLRVTEGTLQPLPPDVRVPAPILKALRRGLRPDPEERWPSMDALKQVLEASLRTRRWAGLVALGGVGAAGVTMALWLGQRPPDPCGGTEAAVARGWNDDAATRVREGIESTGAVFAPDAARGAEQALTRYAERWRAAHRDACMATAVHHTQSEALLDLRMACLELRLDAVTALVDTLAEADVEGARRAVASVEALPPIDACADTQALRGQVPPPEDAETAADVTTLRRTMLRLAAARSLGRTRQVVDEVDALSSAIEAVDYGPLRVEYDYQRGASHNDLDHFDIGVPALEEAYFGAVALGYDEVAIRSAVSLSYAVGYGEGEVDRGLWWGRVARAQIDHRGAPMQRAHLYDTLGILWFAKGEYDRALSFHEQSLALAQAGVEAGVEGATGAVASALMGLGNVSLQQGDFARAHASYERALTLRRSLHGPRHPEISMTLGNMATVRLHEGKYAQAHELLQRSLEIHREAYGPDNAHAASIVADMGTAAAMQGDLDEAARRFAEAAAELTRVLGPDHVRVVATEINLGSLHLARDRPEQARPLLERALEHFSRSGGDSAPQLIEVLHNLALVDLAANEPKAAIEKARRVVALREAAAGPNHPDVLMALAVVAEAQLEQGQVAEARQTAQDGLTRADAIEHEVDPLFRAELELALAMALSREGGEADRALELARSALAVLEPRGELAAKPVAEAKALIERLQ